MIQLLAPDSSTMGELYQIIDVFVCTSACAFCSICDTTGRMDSRFASVKVLIWDFDGTLYKKIPALWRDVREAEFRTIENHMHWPRKKTIEEFEKIHKKVTPSATETVAMICRIPTAVAAVENERYFDRTKYLKKDEKLIALFQKLNKFRHFILANGAHEPIAKAVAALGLPTKTFEEIVTSELVGVNKPHPDGFTYIMKKTNQPADCHLMIGDREAVDLVPANALGMKTCLVWSDKNSMIADITIPTVYDVGKIL